MDKALASRAELELDRSQNPYLKKKKKSQVQQHMPAIPALGKSRQVDPRSFEQLVWLSQSVWLIDHLKSNQGAGEMSQSREDSLLPQRPGLDP